MPVLTVIEQSNFSRRFCIFHFAHLPPPLKFRVILLSCEVILLDIIDRLGLPSIRRFKKTNLLNKINYKIIIINNLLKICKCTIYTTHSSVLFISPNNVLYLLVAFRLVVPLCIGKWMKKLFNSKKWGKCTEWKEKWIICFMKLWFLKDMDCYSMVKRFHISLKEL